MKRKERLLQLLASGRLEDEIIMNQLITYGDLFEEMESKLPEECKPLLYELESRFSESLSGVVLHVYKVGFQDAISLTK